MMGHENDAESSQKGFGNRWSRKRKAGNDATVEGDAPEWMVLKK